MYRAYDLQLDEDTEQRMMREYGEAKDNSWIRGEDRVMKMSPGHIRISEEMKKCISSCLPSGSSLLREDLDRDPYPLVSADVFLMHSKRDTELAMSVAWWMEVNMGLRVFLDSWFRDHSRAIRSEIEFRAGCGMIPEEKRLDMENVAVSGTLVKIIDGTECLMFLDSINAIRDMDPSLGKENYLGRLYYELLVARLIRRRPSERQKREDAEEFRKTGRAKDRTERGNRMLLLDSGTMEEWRRRTEPPLKGHPLDVLYALTPRK